MSARIVARVPCERRYTSERRIFCPLISVLPIQDYPLQKKKLSYEHLREHAHLRMRTNTMSSVMRVRNAAQMAIHRWFQVWQVTAIRCDCFLERC